MEKMKNEKEKKRNRHRNRKKKNQKRNRKEKKTTKQQRNNHDPYFKTWSSISKNVPQIKKNHLMNTKTCLSKNQVFFMKI